MGGVNNNNNTIDKFGRQNGVKKRFARGPPGIGFKLTDDGQYDMEMKKLRNVGEPQKPNDAANQEYVRKQVHIIRTQLTEIINKDLLAKLHEFEIKLEGRLSDIEKTLENKPAAKKKKN